MNNYFNIFCFFSLLLILFFSCESVGGQSTHVVMKHYEGVTTEDCGLTPEELLFDDSCFEWHKKDLGYSDIANGSLIPERMTPFTVFLVIALKDDKTNTKLCTGTIINSNWVITASSCFELCGESISDECLTLTYSGSHAGATIADLNRIEAKKVVIPFSADMLALVNLKEPIDTKKKILSNSVCLPEAKIVNNRTEYAVMMGWGLVIDKIESEDRTKLEVNPRVSWTVIMQGSFNPESDHIELGMMYAQAPSGGPRDCKGDTGAPLIQYYQEWAVLIGVLKDAIGPKGTCVEGPDVMKYIRVAEYMSDIIKELSLN